MILLFIKEDIHQLHQNINHLDMMELEVSKVFLVILYLEELERNFLEYLFQIRIDKSLVLIMECNVLLHR